MKPEPLEAAELVNTWRAQSPESNVTDEDAEDLVLRIIAYGSRSRSKKQKIEEELRRSDLTAQITGRQDIEYGHHESLPRGEHVANMRKRIK